MRVVFTALLAAWCTGCFPELDWQTLPDSQQQARGLQRALWRTPDELWLLGTDPMLVRSKAGVWKAIDLCPEAGWALEDTAFDTGDVVWAQCIARGASDTFKLFRFSADHSSVEVAAPNGDPRLQLIQTGDTVRFAGARELYARDGERWRVLATHPFQFISDGVGESADDFYVNGVFANSVPATSHWNGQALEPTTLPSTAGMTLRNGKLLSGRSRVLAGALVTPAESPDAAGRNLRFVSALDETRAAFLAMPFSTAFEAKSGGGVWLEPGPGAALVFVGHAPFSTGSLSSGGGISFFYAIDETSFLVALPNAVGGQGAKLVEGR